MLMIRRFFGVGALLVSALAWARPPGPSTFCSKYPSSPTCTGAQPPCSYCHSSPPARNAYGQAIEANLLPGAPRPLSDQDYIDNLPAALAAAESADSDGDGFTNLVEIQQGTQPGDGRNFPSTTACGNGTNPNYKVCKYDYRYTYIKLRLDFCGGSPSFAEVKAFEALSDTEKPAQLDSVLDLCLSSEFWKGKNGQLWELTTTCR